jgi:hypothetical protein
LGEKIHLPSQHCLTLVSSLSVCSFPSPSFNTRSSCCCSSQSPRCHEPLDLLGQLQSSDVIRFQQARFIHNRSEESPPPCSPQVVFLFLFLYPPRARQHPAPPRHNRSQCRNQQTLVIALLLSGGGFCAWSSLWSSVGGDCLLSACVAVGDCCSTQSRRLSSPAHCCCVAASAQRLSPTVGAPSNHFENNDESLISSVLDERKTEKEKMEKTKSEAAQRSAETSTAPKVTHRDRSRRWGIDTASHTQHSRAKPIHWTTRLDPPKTDPLLLELARLPSETTRSVLWRDHPHPHPIPPHPNPLLIPSVWLAAVSERASASTTRSHGTHQTRP